MLTRKDRRPRTACELNAAHVTAARSTEGNVLDVSVVQSLPEGAIVPSLTGTNIANRAAVLAALQAVMGGVAGRTRDTIVVLPDAACRMVLLDFESVPDKPEEAEAIVRFRLKKSLPFDVERACVSWQAQRISGKLMVLAAVTYGAVLQEYESVVREVGFSPGVVVPSLLAALGQVDAGAPNLVIKVDRTTTSIAIVNKDALLLVRVLDHPEGRQPSGAQLAEDVYPSLVFFQDTYGMKVEKILVSGVPALDQVTTALVEATGIRAQQLVNASRLGVTASTQLAVLGAVAGALAV